MSQPTSYVRPGAALSHLVNPIVVRLGLATTLIVRGRRSGRELEVPMGAPLEFEGALYLVSGRGQTHWARNVRAAGRCALRHHGRTDRFRAVELSGPERERVVAAYRAKLGHSVDRLFEQIPDAGGHPVFRLDPEPTATGPVHA
jgi:hypothetical protein